jgi:hypothetical protein
MFYCDFCATRLFNKYEFIMHSPALKDVTSNWGRKNSGTSKNINKSKMY